MYSSKNYTEQGGEKTVIGGEIVIEGTLTVKEGATVEGLISTPAENQPEAEAAGSGDDTVKLEDFNTLLASLKAAGIMVADAD